VIDPAATPGEAADYSLDRLLAAQLALLDDTQARPGSRLAASALQRPY
jgi:hypothetical protein